MELPQQLHIGEVSAEQSQPDHTASAETAAGGALRLVRQLCAALEEEKVNYCHWKSNNALHRSASGENDLDLLVDRSDCELFTGVLSRLGFKEFLEAADTAVPGIRNFYGYDSEADRFVHVHAHFQLILGHDLSKNFHIPVERAYLSTAAQSGLFRVPSAEFELIIFVIRMILKHFTWDTILTGQGHLSPNERGELDDLCARADRQEVEQILSAHLALIGKDLFADCLDLLQKKHTLLKQIITGQRLLARLKTFARRPYLFDAALRFWRRYKLGLQRRLLKRSFRKIPASGGAVVAILGGDGAGKTTALDGLYQWIAPHMRAARVHLGKPKWSWQTVLVRGVLKAGTLTGLSKFDEQPGAYTAAPPKGGFSDYAWAIRSVCLARDRFLAYSRARRLAADGCIVFCDRFPLPQFMPMDGPRIEAAAGRKPQNRFIRRLSQIEQGYYRQIMQPEIIFVLKLAPEAAVLRKPDESSESVFFRSTLVWRVDWSQTPAVVIDASLPKDEVLCRLKKLLWERI